MRKAPAALWGALLLFFSVLSCWAGGAAQKSESGRTGAYSGVDSGQFTAPLKIDDSIVINDYPFPWEIENNEDLSVFARLEKNVLLREGGSFNLLVGVKANDREFFKKQEGNYIVYIHNPSRFLNHEQKTALVSVLSKIQRSMGNGSVCALFSPTSGLIVVSSPSDIQDGLERVREDRKNYTGDIILKEAHEALRTLNGPSRLVWVSGESLFSSAQDSRVFDFYLRLYDLYRIGFSYMGFFENRTPADFNSRSGRRREKQRYAALPDWQSINGVLRNSGGASRYLQNTRDLEESLWEDYDRFTHPAVRDLKIRITLMPWISIRPGDNGMDLPNPYYNGYDPRSNLEQSIPAMDYGDHRMSFCYLHIENPNRLFLDPVFGSLPPDGPVPVGSCSVEYYSTSRGERVYKYIPLSIRFTGDYQEYLNAGDEIVSRYSILQNTAFILENLGALADRGDYYAALLWVERQVLILENQYNRIGNKDDPLSIMIAEDIETLKKNRDLLTRSRR